MSKRFTKFSSVILASFLVFMLVRPLAARAVPVEVTVDSTAIQQAVVESTRNAAKKSLSGAIATYLINLTSYAANRAAYDAAVLIASGGNGETPLFDKRTTAQYFSDVGEGVAGQAIGLLNENLEAADGVLGDFNLCAPTDPQVLLSFKLGLKAAFERPEPLCDFNEVKENWQGFLASVASNGEGGVFRNQLILTELANAYDDDVNEFSVGIQLYTDILGKSMNEASISATEHIENDGFKGVTNAITGQVETPASLIKDDFFLKNQRAQTLPNEVILALMSNSDAMLQIGIQAGSVFTNTLLSQLTQKIYNGFFDFEQTNVDPFNPTDFASSNGQSARDSYRALLSVNALEITNYSILAEFSSCPTQSRGLYNCVADNSFISAIARADSGVPLTVQEAMEDGLIDGSWPLISSGDHARDQDPYCYTYAFCSSNLVKLRKARVISIGWELAANSAANSVDTPVTLREVVDGFDDCNAAGSPDDNHPWCKLIDPTWVLKYPETQCRADVNGQLLASSAAGERQDECVDMPSCIAEDGSGACTGGYGYCVREENIWRFRGESCPVEFASCITVEGEDKTASYLRNTTDPGPCTADNAGCQAYATVKTDADNDGTYEWPAITDVAADEAAADAYKDRIYFTGQVEECDAADGNCRELIERTDSLSLNILQNPSFEDDADNSGLPDTWLFTNRTQSLVSTDGSVSRSNNSAVSAGASGVIYQSGVSFSQGRFYTMSFYARQRASETGASATMLIAFSADDGSAVDLTGLTLGDGCVLQDGNGDGDPEIVKVTGTPAGSTYERFTCTFTSPLVANPAANIYAFVDVLGGNAMVDDLMVEQGEVATNYHEGYSTGEVTTLTVKVPPTYLGCTGSPTDPAACQDYAQVCSENDVGCSAYTPTNGDPTVNGVATALDYCPSVCVGYDTYKQEATLYEPSGVFPVYFIPDTAEECSEEEVGCDEFTNLTNEGLEYFTYLRACVTPSQADANVSSDGAATFYTWEGSDTEGYQLKTWVLLESNLGSGAYAYNASGDTDSDPGAAPCVSPRATENGMICADALDRNGDGAFDWDTSTCDEHSDILANPDCREFYDANGGIHYRTWSNTVTVDNACSAYRKTDIAGNTDTEREDACEDSGGFFDAANASCRYYGFRDESATCSEAANGCREYTGGRSRNSRVAFEDTLEDGSLNNWDAGSASRITYSNESLATDGHSIAATEPFGTFIVNNGSDCTDAAGCEGSARSLGGFCVVLEGERYCGTLEGELFSGKTYTLSFWAKGTGTLASGFDLNAGGAPAVDVPFGSVDLDTDWHEYSLGPLNMTANAYPSFGEGTALAFIPSGTVYLDNIVLREGEENITLIKDSWVTPASCDQSPMGATAPQYYLGCQEYTDQTGEEVNLKSFSRLCDEDKVGCQDFYMTEESTSPYAEVHNAYCSTVSGLVATSATACYYTVSGSSYDTSSPYLCTIGIGETRCAFNLDWYVDPANLQPHLSFGASTVVVPADKDVFLVVNDDVTCANGVAGCTEFGKPNYNQDRNSTTGATSVYLMNDPDAYDDILCKQDELFCAEWTGSAGTKYYFKDPGEQVCEYRTDVTVGGTQYDGWFRTGTNEFCYGTCSDGVTACSSDAQCGTGTCNVQDPSYVVNGNFSGIWNNGDNNYGGWVGACSSEYDSCTQFEDPLDVGADELYGTGTGTSYTYLNNSSLKENSLPSSQQCNGKVSLKEGCSLFNDTGLSSQNYQSSATEMSSRHADALFNAAPFDLVEPINCESGDSTITLADGSTVDLCASRCLYDLGAVNDISDGVLAADKLSNSRARTFGVNELYDVGGSCYTASDCAPLTSQTGETVEASSCATNFRDNYSDQFARDFAAVPRLENDTNTVLKVNRDRQCSEWLSCADAQTVWDERTNSYRTVCGDIELCQEYATIGNASFCSKWSFETPEVVLDEETYTSRDVTWYGDEYSGYAIPDLFPVQTLSQVNVAPPAGTALTEVAADLRQYIDGTCDLDDLRDGGYIDQSFYDEHSGATCHTDNDCGANGGAMFRGVCVVEDNAQDYRLVLDAGSCNEDYAGSCTVGTCSETGAACSTTDECGLGGGTCIVGSCLGIHLQDSCQSDSDCDTGDICNGGVCATPGADVDADDFDPSAPNASCVTGQTFVGSVGLKTGSCISDRCILAPDGSAFAFGQTEQQVCRAYPELNSPFSSDIVEEWYDTATQGKLATGEIPTWDDVPYNTRSGFENASFCAPGEDCMCTYKKITFGETGDTRYVSPTFSVGSLGICNGGLNGHACSEDEDCLDDKGNSNVNDDEAGTCERPTREDTLIGMTGYCLERDSAININGDRDESACITWLPVDQLAGSTDLYAKYTTAGYFEDASVCAYTDLFVNLGTSHVPVEDASYLGLTSMACAGSGVSGTGDVSYSESYSSSIINSCADNATCPAGYWALVGQPSWKDGSNTTGHIADACIGEPYSTQPNDCPYVCIPIGAAVSGGSCDPDGDFTEAVLQNHGVEFDYTSSLPENVRAVGKEATSGTDYEGLNRFDMVAKDLAACRVKGVRYTDELAAAINQAELGEGADNDDPYRNLKLEGEWYAACQDSIKVADSTYFDGFAWTDRLLNPNSGFVVAGGADAMNYTALTTPVPFGITSELPENRQSPEGPFAAAGCVDSAGNIVPPNGDDLNTCADGYTFFEAMPDINPEDAEGRSFLEYEIGGSSWSSHDNIWSVLPTTNTLNTAFNRINQLFAATKLSFDNLFKWNGEWSENGGTDFAYEDADVADGEYDYEDYDVRDTAGNPPVVWAIESRKCTGTECEEAQENAFTVNDENSGDLSAEGFFRAYLKFYAAADKNQLPIRRVIIDWGDTSQSGSADADNFYKNHRGLQEGSTNSKCDLETEWGLTDASCDPNYFSYTHIYTCSSELIREAMTDVTKVCNDANNDGNLDVTPCVNTPTNPETVSCSFQPRVHVRDNWGWCAGTCNGQDGCYDGDGHIDGAPGIEDQCDYTKYPESITDRNNPWIYFDGVITVKP